MDIISVKELSDTEYLLNGTISVPKILGNRHYEAILLWLSEGNIVDPADVVGKAEKIAIAERDLVIHAGFRGVAQQLVTNSKISQAVLTEYELEEAKREQVIADLKA